MQEKDGIRRAALGAARADSEWGSIIAELEAEIEGLKDDINARDTEIQELEEKLNSLDEDNDALRDALEDIGKSTRWALR